MAQNWSRNSPGGPPEEMSYIPREQSIRPPNLTEDNVNPLDLASYMHLPTTGQDNKIYGKCGEQGHVKRQCRTNVVCDFCKTRSHATLACRTYANLVKEHPLMSSRKNTPEKFQTEIYVNQVLARRVEQELRKWQIEVGPTGKPPLPQARRQHAAQPQQYPIQGQTYSQDVRVQMGEPFHSELHHPEQMTFNPNEYQPTIKVNNHFITENVGNHRREHQTFKNYATNGPQAISKNLINHNVSSADTTER